jgi:hypothetical protein
VNRGLISNTRFLTTLHHSYHRTKLFATLSRVGRQRGGPELVDPGIRNPSRIVGFPPAQPSGCLRETMARLTVNLVYPSRTSGAFFSPLAAAVPRFHKRATGQSHLLALSRTRSLPPARQHQSPGYHATQVPIHPSGKSRFASHNFFFLRHLYLYEQDVRTFKNGTLLLCKHASESCGTLISNACVVLCLHMAIFLSSSTPFSRPLSIIGNQPKPCR